MGFWKDEIWKGELVPAFKSSVRGIINGVKWIVDYIKNAFTHWMTTGTAVVNETENKTIQHAWEIHDWQMLMAGIMLLLVGLSARDPKFLREMKDKFLPEKKNDDVAENEVKDIDVAAKSVLPTEQTLMQPSNQSGIRERKSEEVVVAQHAPQPADNSNDQIAFIDKIDRNREAFTDKLVDVSNRLFIDPSWLMIVMRMESKLMRNAINVYSGTVGLIQWTIANAAKHLGMVAPRKLQIDEEGRIIITPQIKNIQDAMKSKTGVEQLEFIYEYLAPYKGRLNDVYDVYFAVFYPVAMNKKDSFELGSERSIKWMRRVYEGNSNLDLVFGDKDGHLEVSDVKAWVKAHFPPNYKNT